MEESYNELRCVALLGDTAVGKSALAQRYIDKSRFVDQHEPTIVDTSEKTIHLYDFEQKEREIKLRIKDIGNAHADKHFILDQDAFMILFDLTNEDSFDNVSKHNKLILETY